MTLYDVFSWSVIILQIIMFSAIVRRLRSADDLSGIDVGGECIVASMSLGWVVFGVGLNETPVWLSGAISSVGCAIIVVSKLVHDGVKRHMRRVAVFSVPVLAAVSLLWVFCGFKAVGVFVTAGSIVQYLPQLRHSVIDIVRKRPATGASVLGCGMRCLYHVLWFGYACVATPVNIPILVYAAMGALTFGAQTYAAVSSKRARKSA